MKGRNEGTPDEISKPKKETTNMPTEILKRKVRVERRHSEKLEGSDIIYYCIIRGEG